MAVLFALIPKALMSIGLKLLSEKLVEELILFGLKTLAGSTKTKVDDKLYDIVDKALKENDDA